MSEDRIYCDNCGSRLHIATTMNGTPYWASNSGSSRCVWPNPPTQRHVVETAEVTA